ncbi:MAG: Signal transduction histidine-protein kinase BaeS, partial [Pseudomonadota bacterium]
MHEQPQRLPNDTREHTEARRSEADVAAAALADRIHGADLVELGFRATLEGREARRVRGQAEASVDVPHGTLAGAQAAAWTLGRSPDGSPCTDAADHEDRGIWELLGVGQREECPFEERLRCAVHPEDFQHLLDTIREALLRQEPLEVAFRTHPQRGPIRWILKRGRPAFDANQQCRRFTGLCIDITQQKRVEQAQAEALRRLSRANELAGIGHFRYDVARGDVEYDVVVQRMIDLPERRAHLDQIRSRVDPASLQALHNGLAQSVARREDKFQGALAL